MTNRIFRSMVLLVLLASIAVTVLVSVLLYNNHLDEIKNTIRNETEYIASYLNAASEELVEEMETVLRITSGRVTIIDSDGTVLFDSVTDAVLMENHGGREEVVRAMKYGIGEAARHSTTIDGQTSYYFARRLIDGRVLRMAYDTASLYNSMFSVSWASALTVVALAVLAMLVSKSIAAKIIEPINKLDLANPLENHSYDELLPLLKRLDEQNRQIAAQVAELTAVQKEFSAIIGSMREGLIVLSSRGLILSANASAAELLSFDKDSCEGRHILEFESGDEMKMLIERLREGKSAEADIERPGRCCRLLANPVEAGGGILLILDVTEQVDAERFRKEFSANVSHELKTPLQSISGYAEIMKNGLARPEDFPRFTERIYTEAQRLIALVEDIIKLSRLDEGKELDFRPVNLLETAREVAATLDYSAEKAEVAVEVTGEDAVVSGEGRMLHELVYNLLENAIRYNRAGGSVELNVKTGSDGEKLLTVSDTGCGIPLEHQPRVFERFYRVDKSHSRKTGGTGLGLSIVKHTASLHNARIKLESAVGIGTEITVIFEQPGDI